MARHFTEISRDSLKEKIIEEGKKSQWHQDSTEDMRDSILLLEGQVKKDISKVNFDHENCKVEEDSGWNHSINPHLGLNTLDNGLTYLGVLAGGDWEEPVFYIVYWDGKKLRGYVPKNGNTWNQETMTAYGSEQEAGSQYENYYDQDPEPVIPAMNPELIFEDIKQRILHR